MKISPIAEFLLKNKAIPKKTERNIVDFYTQNNEYLGSLTKGNCNKGRFVSLTVFDKTLKPLYHKMVELLEPFENKIYIAGETVDNDRLINPSFLRKITEIDFSKNLVKKTTVESKLKTKLKLMDEYLPYKIYKPEGKISYSKPVILEDLMDTDSAIPVFKKLHFR